MTENNLSHWITSFEELLPKIAIVFIVLVAVFSMIYLILKVLHVRRFLHRKLVFLEVTPPTKSDQTRDATQRLFSVLHGLRDGRTFIDKAFGYQATLSLEITSTRQGGIRYIVGTSESDANNIERSIAAYVADAHIRRIDHDSSPQKNGQILDIKQAGHFAYPLHAYKAYDQHDPMAYINGAMTKLEPGEIMSTQMIIRPVKVREASIIAKRIFHNEELLYQLGHRKVPLIGSMFNMISSVLFGILDGVSEGLSSTHTNYKHQPATSQHKQQVAMKIKPARVLSAFEQGLAQTVNDKLNQPLYRVDLRILVAANDKQSETQRIKGVREWLTLFNVPKYQSLKVRHNFPAPLRNCYRSFLFTHRMPTFFAGSSALLSASEIADLYHFPNSQASKTENVVKSLSKTLPAPISLKGETDFDVVIGRNLHHGASTPIGLTAAERERHVFIIGGTGNGKTTMLQYKIVQDIRNGKGVAVVDPHGDMAELLLRYIPEERINDVIYFNPDDLEHPIGLNILELTPGLEGDELLREKDLVTESVVSIFRKIFSEDDSGGHRIEYVLRNAIQTALTVEDATLFTVYNLLNDPKYCKKIVAALDNDDLKNFWKNELGKAGGYQQVKMVAGITAKIGRFLFSASAKRILEQPKSTINFDDILNGKILICNLSKGLLGEDTSELFGISILAKIQMAALRRVRVQQKDRRPFYLYVDEFQNFATLSFTQMLSEARKYKLFLIMAEQSTSQQDDQKMVDIILANVGTIICFRSGSPADERLMLPLFKPYVQEGEIANLPSYNFYMRISAINSQEPFSGETLLLHPGGGNKDAELVVRRSRISNAITIQSKVSSNDLKPKLKVAKLPGDL